MHALLLHEVLQGGALLSTEGMILGAVNVPTAVNDSSCVGPKRGGIPLQPLGLTLRGAAVRQVHRTQSLPVERIAHV